MKPPPMGTDARTRTFAEARVVDFLLLCGWARDAHRGDCGDARREVRAALDRSTALGLPYARAADGGRLDHPAEVVNFLKWASVRHQDAFWRDHYVPQGRAPARAFHGARSATGVPPPPATLVPRRFDVELEREFALARLQSRTRTMLRIPAPIEDRMLCDLAVECSGPPGVDVDFAVAPGRADARFAASDSAAIRLKVRASFTALPGLPDPRATPLSPADVDLYTRPAEGLVRVSPRVHALAEHLAGAARGPWQVVRSFWDFVGDALTWGVVDYTRLDAAQPLDHVLECGWFDCQLGSALLVALCRSRGIPAASSAATRSIPTAPRITGGPKWQSPTAAGFRSTPTRSACRTTDAIRVARLLLRAGRLPDEVRVPAAHLQPLTGLSPAGRVAHAGARRWRSHRNRHVRMRFRRHGVSRPDRGSRLR